MNILAIDSSSLVASVAITIDDVLAAEYTVNFKKTHSQTLLPMIDEIISMIQIDINTIDLIAISGGPGSFTGLRIGSATAKGLGLALDLPLVHVPTLGAMAYNLYATKMLICPIMDARRDQVYTGIYTFEGETLKNVLEECALPITELLEIINELDQEIIFLGDGVPVHKEYISKNLKNKQYFAPAHVNRQRASSVAALGKIYYEEGKYIPSEDYVPDYIRVSQAERELNEIKENDA